MIYAHKGERIVTPEGKYLGAVSRDIDSKDRWSFSMFDDLQMDIARPTERLPLTLWLLDKERGVR